MPVDARPCALAFLSADNIVWGSWRAERETWRHEVILWRPVRSPDRSTVSISGALWTCRPGLHSLCSVPRCCSQGPESPPPSPTPPLPVNFYQIPFLWFPPPFVLCPEVFKTLTGSQGQKVRREHRSAIKWSLCISPQAADFLMVLHLLSPFYCLRLKLFSLFSTPHVLNGVEIQSSVNIERKCVLVLLTF